MSHPGSALHAADAAETLPVERNIRRRALEFLERGTPPAAAPARVALAIAGATGLVGRAFLRVLQEKSSWLRNEHRLELTTIGAINRRRLAWDAEGIAPASVTERLTGGGTSDWGLFAARLFEHHGAPLVFLDCTASPFIARQYAVLLRAGISIVTPNKIANTFEYPYYAELRRLGHAEGRKYFYETTVGAATPMIRTLEHLRQTGDRVHRIEGVLSGTLSFVFGRLNEGKPFSDAVRDAVTRGFTEPHPASDLSGEDVARKLLILAREAGYPLEREEISVQGLVPPEFQVIQDPAEFIRRLSSLDAVWSSRVRAAADRGNRLVYLARFDGTQAAAGVAEVSAGNLFARLRASENAVQYSSDRHTPLPLTIQGAGAGPELTARGILADLIEAAGRNQ
ncbi:MAG: aspartate kinase [Bacteroidota bacterium]